MRCHDIPGLADEERARREHIGKVRSEAAKARWAREKGTAPRSVGAAVCNPMLFFRVGRASRVGGGANLSRAHIDPGCPWLPGFGEIIQIPRSFCGPLLLREAGRCRHCFAESTERQPPSPREEPREVESSVVSHPQKIFAC